MNSNDFDDWNREAILRAALEYRSTTERYRSYLIYAEEKLLRVTVERDRLRKALRFYAHGEWADGYPGGVFVDTEHTELDFGGKAQAALQEAGDE